MLKNFLLKLIPDKLFLKRTYKKSLNKTLNLKNPETFNEKLQWLKLYNRNPLYTTLVDKFAVKQWVSKKIGPQYIIPTYGVWNRFDDVEFDKLPNQFVLKCTHDSGGVVVCKNKMSFDKAAARKKITECLKRNYYYSGREWPYKNVQPRIIAEKYMEDKEQGELRDYKFYTFNGEPHFLLLATNRLSSSKELNFDYFDMSFNHLPLVNHWHPNNTDGIPSKPIHFEEMKQLARKLAEGIPHVRVDFYEANGLVYFGEMTFYDMSGFLRLSPPTWEKEWGDLIKLPEKKYKC